MTTILITGTNRGIGLELARQALAKGWTVYGSARRPVTEPDAHICGHANFHDLVFDVTDHAAVREAAAQIDAPIDILINNAGMKGPDRQSALDMDFDGLARTLAVNTIAPLAVTQAFLPHLKRSSAPRVLTISSQLGSMQLSGAGWVAYNASKAGLNKACQGLALELKALGIAHATMHPGWVQTDMGGASADITPQESAAGILTVAEGLTLETTGRFLNWDGTTRPW